MKLREAQIKVELLDKRDLGRPLLGTASNGPAKSDARGAGMNNSDSFSRTERSVFAHLSKGSANKAVARKAGVAGPMVKASHPQHAALPDRRGYRPPADGSRAAEMQF